jgi:AhpC/TSA family
MAETPSTMLKLGAPLPATRLKDVVSERDVDAAALARGQKGLLVAFLCNHCPYVKHIRSELVRVAHGALDQGLAVVFINANDEVDYPEDGPAEMRKLAVAERWRFPYLFDATQQVAKAYQAACTPDLYLFDAGLKLAYRGQFDDARPSKPVKVTGASLQAAIDAVLAGRAPSVDQKPSLGCNIKWKKGQEPAYGG